MELVSPKEKAIEIYNSFEEDCDYDEAGVGEKINFQKNCAVICVKHIIKSWEEDGTKNDFTIVEWWKKVLLEIDLL